MVENFLVYDIHNDFYRVAITALLPLTACMLVSQANPYHALVIRGILGAVAALVYALFGAADVALTEALVGTMLSITLYAVAVRSSLSLRLGVIVQDPDVQDRDAQDLDVQNPDVQYAESSNLSQANQKLPDQLLQTLSKILNKHHLRLEILPYPSLETLKTALTEKEIHAMLTLPDHSPGLAEDEVRKNSELIPGKSSQSSPPWQNLEPLSFPLDQQTVLHFQTRIPRIYDLIRTELL